MKKFLRVIFLMQIVLAAYTVIGLATHKISIADGATSLSIIMVSATPRTMSGPRVGPSVATSPNAGGNGAAGAPSTLAPGQSVTLKPVIRSTKVTITSPPDAAAVPTTIYLYNNRDLQDITTNGGVALTYNYEDGFSGTQTSNKIGLANGAEGQICYGCYIRALADGVADPAGLSDSEPFLIQYVGRGLLGVPYVIDIDDNETRSDNDDSIGVVRFPDGVPFDFNTQFGLTINGDAAVTYKITVKMYFFPDFKV